MRYSTYNPNHTSVTACGRCTQKADKGEGKYNVYFTMLRDNFFFWNWLMWVAGDEDRLERRR